MCRPLPLWIDHRQKQLGIESHEALSDLACVDPALVEGIVEHGTLAGVGRSARAYLARALEVTVRDLEDLASGKIDWIADSRRLDWDRLTPDCLRILGGQETVEAMGPTACAPSRGVPVVGRIAPTGCVELMQDGSDGEPHRIPVRYHGVPDAYALRATDRLPQYPRGASIVFRGLPPGELRDGEEALIYRGDAGGESVFCRVLRDGPAALRLISLQGEDGPPVPMEAVLRAGRVIGSFDEFNG